MRIIQSFINLFLFFFSTSSDGRFTIFQMLCFILRVMKRKCGGRGRDVCPWQLVSVLTDGVQTRGVADGSDGQVTLHRSTRGQVEVERSQQQPDAQAELSIPAATYLGAQEARDGRY